MQHDGELTSSQKKEKRFALKMMMKLLLMMMMKVKVTKILHPNLLASNCICSSLRRLLGLLHLLEDLVERVEGFILSFLQILVHRAVLHPVVPRGYWTHKRLLPLGSVWEEDVSLVDSMMSVSSQLPSCVLQHVVDVVLRSPHVHVVASRNGLRRKSRVLLCN